MAILIRVLDIAEQFICIIIISGISSSSSSSSSSSRFSGGDCSSSDSTCILIGFDVSTDSLLLAGSSLGTGALVVLALV